jgi:hypothetical protein
MTTAQVHRFRDKVAVYVGNGETVYMTAKEARALARAIGKVAKSVETQTFAQSDCGMSYIVFAKDSNNA